MSERSCHICFRPATRSVSPDLDKAGIYVCDLEECWQTVAGYDPIPAWVLGDKWGAKHYRPDTYLKMTQRTGPDGSTIDINSDGTLIVCQMGQIGFDVAYIALPSPEAAREAADKIASLLGWDEEEQ